MSAEHVGPFHGPGAVVSLVSLLFPLIFILSGCLLSLLGVWCVLGQSEIVVTAHEIRSAFRLGPLAWWGRRDRRQVRRVVVERTAAGQDPAAALASLFAETDEGRPLLLAFVHPCDWLVPLARDLADRGGAPGAPLPVVVRDTSRATTRRWRRDRAADGKKPVPGCFLLIWGLGFFSGGALFFVFILLALIRGDPDDSLQGAYPWKCLWILFPFPFIIPGALALRHTVNRRTTAGLSPEQLKAVEAVAPAPADEAGVLALTPAAPGAEYPTVPAVSHAPGSELPVRLTQGLSPGWGVLLFLGLVLLCSGVVTPLAAYVINSLRAGQFDSAMPAVCFLLVPGFLWVILTGLLVREFRLWRLGHPVVEVSALPLYCGETCDVLVTVPGPARLRRLRVAVVCEEEVSYTEGTTTRKETRRVYDQELARQEDLAIERGEPLRVRGSVPVPPGAMHSFQAEHNQVRWVVRVEGEAQRLFALKFTHDYALPVRPPRGYGRKA